MKPCLSKKTFGSETDLRSVLALIYSEPDQSKRTSAEAYVINFMENDPDAFEILARIVLKDSDQGEFPFLCFTLWLSLL